MAICAKAAAAAVAATNNGSSQRKARTTPLFVDVNWRPLRRHSKVGVVDIPSACRRYANLNGH
jgi:hypothetical protein